MPYPYRALLAVSSDLDETPDRTVYLETMRFLNTLAVGTMGPGVGLEVGNSIYFDMSPAQFAYWTTDDTGRAMVRDLMRSGHVDVLHSFGDLAVTRAHAARALEELDRYGCRVEVWVDHAVAPTNLGGDIMRGSGDVPGRPAYHADLAMAYGVHYVWRGRVTSVIGQNVPRTLGGILTPAHPVASGRSLAKELVKGVLGRFGHEKYAMHASNNVLRRVMLRSGDTAYEFLRSNPHWGGVSSGETADGLPDVLDQTMIEQLVEREGVCLLYTHLGKTREGRLFKPATCAAFRRLGRLRREGRLLVTTTRRALGYCRASAEIAWSVAVDPDGALHIALVTHHALPASDLDGLSFYVRDSSQIRMTLNGRAVRDLRKNPPDHTGRPSVSLPWRPLEFPL